MILKNHISISQRHENRKNYNWKAGFVILLSILITLILFCQTLLADESKLAKGLEIFNEVAGCAGCHILKAAGSEGNVGPNLDTVSLTEDYVREMVTYGLGVMPCLLYTSPSPRD